MSSGIFAFLADDPEWLGSILMHRPEVLGEPARHSGSWHIVFHQDGDVLARTHPGGSHDADRFLAFLRRIRTRVMLGDFDPPPAEGTRDSMSCRAMGWAYTQLRESRGFEKVRTRIFDALPAFLARTLGGTGEAEHLFHLILAFLYDSGKLASPDLPPSELARGIRHALMMLEQVYPQEGLALPSSPLFVSNGFCIAGWTGERDMPTTVFFRPPELEESLHRGVGSHRESGEIPLYPRNGRRAVLVASFLERSYADSVTGHVPARTLFGITPDCRIENYDF